MEKHRFLTTAVLQHWAHWPALEVHDKQHYKRHRSGGDIVFVTSDEKFPFQDFSCNMIRGTFQKCSHYNLPGGRHVEPIKEAAFALVSPVLNSWNRTGSVMLREGLGCALHQH